MLSERPSLLRRVGRLVGADSAEDVAQKIWLKVQAIRDDPPIIDKTAYLHRLAHNVAFDHMKGEQRQRDIQAEAAALLHDGVDGISGERIALARHDLMRVQSMIASLPDRTREIFLLSRLEGLPQREIAVRLGVSRPTVEKHLRHAFDAVAAVLSS
jgi:RNA polymerase sigma-70 factor (ECF subfamily)